MALFNRQNVRAQIKRPALVNVAQTRQPVRASIGGGLSNASNTPSARGVAIRSNQQRLPR